MKREIIITAALFIGMCFFGAVYFFNAAVWAEVLSLLCMCCFSAIVFLLTREV